MTKYIEAPSNLDEIINLYKKQGSTLSSIERITGHSRNSLKNWFKSAGVELKSHTVASAEANRRDTANMPLREEFEADFSKMNLKQLQEKYGIGQKKLYIWMDIYGLKKDLGEAVSFGKSKSFIDALPEIDNIQLEYKRSGYNKVALASKLNLTRHQLDALFEINGVLAIPPQRSKAEINILDSLKVVDPEGEWIGSDKTVIYPLELDVYSPVRKLAIEYCGLYWHSQMSGCKNSTYHLNKYLECEKQEVRLITVFESDPIDKIYSLISMLAGKSIRIAGRDTIVEKSSRQMVVSHEEQNHISGSAPAKLYYCLRHKKTGEILSTMSFGTPRFSKGYQWEIIRYTVRNGYTVIGGASKLFSKFVEENKPSDVMTYADLRFGTGEIYKRLGFELNHVSGPNYWYFKKNTLKLNHRAGFQKHKLKNRLEIFDSRLTEFENMVVNGYDRIWDCGNAVYSWNSTKYK